MATGYLSSSPLNKYIDYSKVSGNTPGAFQYADGGQATMKPPVAPTPTPTQSPTQSYVAPKSEPTIAEQLASINDQALNLQSMLNSGQVTGLTRPFSAPTADAYGDPTIESWLKNEAYQTVDEDAIRRAQLRMFQKEIDATNQVYDQMVNTARIEGEGRLGSQAAMGARAGILGSDFANAQEQAVRGFNRDIVGGIQAERQAKIAGIMGLARKNAADEISAKTLAKKQGAEAYLQYLAGKSTRRGENMNKLAAALYDQGIDPSSLSPQELEKIASDFGTSKDEIMSVYSTYKTQADTAAAEADLERRKTESEIDKNSRITLSEGEAYLDEDGNVIYKNPKTYAPSSGGEGGVSGTRQSINYWGITNKYQADPVILGGTKAATAVAIANQVLSDPDNAGNQLKSLYSLVKNLDPDSAVREGEIDLAQKAQSYMDTWESKLVRIGKGRIIDPDTASALAQATIELATAWEQAATKRQQQYRAQADIGGVGEEFNAYLGSYDSGFNAGSLGADLSTLSDEELARIASGG